ncbi:MAG: hypothetical protein CMB31_02180 [Euryarchaeota archaeon]|nr:hypothetical protein [Euryarchaeota archaeon]
MTRRGGRRDFLFDDLVNLSPIDIENIHLKLKKNFATKEAIREEKQAERKQLLDFVKELRNLLLAPSRGPEISELISKLQIEQSNKNAAEKLRDEINERVPPKQNQIIKSLKDRHKLLWTISNKMIEIPSLEEEIELFESFFEYQAMYEVKIQATEQEEIWREASKQIKKIFDAIKKFELEGIDETKLLQLKEQFPEQNIIGWETVEIASNQIAELEKWSEEWRRDKRSEHKEIQRIEAFLRITEEEKRKESLKIKSEEIREKVETGGTLSLDDLSALISTGEISKISEPKIKNTAKDKTNKKVKKQKSSTKRGALRSKKESSKHGGND